MRATLHGVGRRLPRGWRDLGLQIAIWLGFLAVYQVARGVAGHNPAVAFGNGLRLIGIESRLDSLYELTFQRAVDGSRVLVDLVTWTYWNSEFTVVGLTLLWVYLRRHEHFVRFRNAILLANVLGLLGYVLVPTAPPRMFPALGFTDPRGGMVNHGSGLVELAANPYAAMPSLHAADALIVGLTLAVLCRHRVSKVLWLLWPGWVWFSVMATANHFWLDVAAGIVLALVAMAVVYRREVARFVGLAPAPGFRTAA